MASTRQLCRARKTASTHPHQHQHFRSRIASTAPETAAATSSKVAETPESDEGSSSSGSSPQPETSINRSTTAFCKNCNSKVGDFYNSWHKVTSSYYSPALLGSYRSLLQRSGQRKEASKSTDLAGCTIDLTYCPSCDDCLGFVVVDAPADGKRFCDRNLFKLQCIELRCNISPNRAITVQPQQDVAPDLVAFEGSTSPLPGPDNTATEIMDLGTPLSSSHPLWTKPAQTELQREHQQFQSKEPLCKPLQSNGAQPRAAILYSSANQRVATPVTASATIPPSTSPQPAQPHSESTTKSSVKDTRPGSAVNGRNYRHSYPREPREVYFDAIERLQTQTAQNTSALSAQARSQVEHAEIMRQMEGNLRHELQTQLHRQDQELRRMDESVNRLLQELQDCRRTIVSLVQEVNATGAENARRPSEIAQSTYQDEALELMARRIGEISHRTTDLETLSDQVAIVSGKVQRLESESTATHNPHSRPTVPVYQPAHLAHIAHATPQHSNHASPFQAPDRSPPNPQPVQYHEKPIAVVPSENSCRHEPAPSQNGWAMVNAGVKRAFEDDINSPHQGASSAPGSPKRPRVVTVEPQDAHSIPQIPPGPSHVVPSQAQSFVTSQPQPQPGPYPESHPEMQPGTHPGSPSPQAYAHYGTQNGPSEQGWRSESQRAAESRPARGRGSRGGRGPGSRGGRVRKSMQGQHHPVGTPEKERDGWTAVPDSQTSRAAFEGHSVYAVRSVMRRGSGGSGGSGMRGGSSWTAETGTRGVYHDSPSETKKTRSKPVRNEEGILVRKDGRPDRRSQSSAANLRKVHARKEEQQRENEAESTPTSLHQSMSTGPDTPSPTPRSHPEQDITSSVRKRHNDILGKIFPDGIDTSRRQHDYAHQVFNEDRDHTAHPRAQSSRTIKTPLQIKGERAEGSEVAESRTPTNDDVDTYDAGTTTNRHTPDETHPPTGK